MGKQSIKQFVIGGVLIGASFLIPGGAVGTRIAASFMGLGVNSALGGIMSAMSNKRPVSQESALKMVASPSANVPLIFMTHRSFAGAIERCV